MGHPLLFWIGYQKLRMDGRYAGELMNICRREGYVYRRFVFSDDTAEFECSLHDAKKVAAACRRQGIPVILGEERGLPSLLCRYRYRFGIWVGVLLFVCMLFFSGQVVWEIRVEGNDALSDRQVIDRLAACGMTVGDRIASLDTAVLENRVLIASDDISWISINLLGTVAEVEIRESLPLPEKEDYVAANLIAGRSGTVEWFENVRGNIAVKIGAVVEEGDLLVGGIYNTTGGGFRYTCAGGSVYARTEHDFEVEIPLQYEKKIYNGREKIQKSLIFFKKEVKFFGNTGNSHGTCDTIDTVTYWELPGGVVLPFGIHTIRTVEYETVQSERDAARAEELAYYRLYWQMEGDVPHGKLLRKQIAAELTDHAYILRCTADYVEDIAKMQEIQIEGIFS